MMSELVKLPTKTKKSNEEIEKESIDKFYTNMEDVKEDLHIVLTLAYSHDGDSMMLSNGLDPKTILWMLEDFKLNLLSGAFDDF